MKIRVGTLRFAHLTCYVLTNSAKLFHATHLYCRNERQESCAYYETLPFLEAMNHTNKFRKRPIF